MSVHFQTTAVTNMLERARTARNGGRTIIFETHYGSGLYGCATETSDNDIRGVYLPGLADFLTEARAKPCALSPDGDLGESTDVEYYPSGMFIWQVLGMKVNSVEIFMAALAAQRRGDAIHPAMAFLLQNRDRLLHADPAGFIGHAFVRAKAYVDPEDRDDPVAHANRHILLCLEEVAKRGGFDVELRIEDVEGLAERLAEHDLVRRTKSGEGQDVLMVNSKQLPLNHRVGEAILRTRERLERFSKPADLSNPRRMYKDLYTALRMMEASVELMETGEITFPCKRAEFYSSVRAGEVARERVLELMKQANTRALEIVAKGQSALPPMPDGSVTSAILEELNAQMRWFALKNLNL